MPKHIEKHYFDVTEEAEKAGIGAGTLIMAHEARQDKESDYAILVDDGIIHRWGRNLSQVQGQTFSPMNKKEIKQARKSRNLFADYDFAY